MTELPQIEPAMFELLGAPLRLDVDTQGRGTARLIRSDGRAASTPFVMTSEAGLKSMAIAAIVNWARTHLEGVQSPIRVDGLAFPLHVEPSPTGNFSDGWRVVDSLGNFVFDAAGDFQKSGDQGAPARRARTIVNVMNTVIDMAKSKMVIEPALSSSVGPSGSRMTMTLRAVRSEPEYLPNRTQLEAEITGLREYLAMVIEQGRRSASGKGLSIEKWLEFLDDVVAAKMLDAEIEKARRADAEAAAEPALDVDDFDPPDVPGFDPKVAAGAHARSHGVRLGLPPDAVESLAIEIERALAPLAGREFSQANVDEASRIAVETVNAFMRGRELAESHQAARRLAAMKDEEIDTSDIPEAGPEFFEKARLVEPAVAGDRVLGRLDAIESAIVEIRAALVGFEGVRSSATNAQEFIRQIADRVGKLEGAASAVDLARVKDMEARATLAAARTDAIVAEQRQPRN